MKCLYCRNDFKSFPSANRKYCSITCFSNSRIGKPTWNKNIKGQEYIFKGKAIKNNCKCEACGNKFHLKECAIKRGRGRFCSRLCCTNKRSEWMKGSGNHQYNKHWGKGEGNPNWRGGVSILPYHFTFTNKLKEEIRNRDGYECMNCHMPEQQHMDVYNTRLNIHHIDYNKSNCKKINLITVCKVCNSRANFKRDWWKKFFKSILSQKEVSK